MNSLIEKLEEDLQRERIREMVTDKRNRKAKIRTRINSLKKAIALYGDQEKRGIETAD